VCASIKRYIGILYISRWSRKSLSCIDGGGGGGCLNETIFGQVQATTINGYNCLHAVWDTSYFLCVCDRAADAARGISNSCHGMVMQHPPARGRRRQLAVCGTSCQKKSMFRVRGSSRIAIVRVCVVFCARLVSMRTRRLRVRKCRRAKNRRKPCEHHLLYVRRRSTRCSPR
jgi:hypothetical protein